MQLLQHNGEIIELYVVLLNNQKSQIKSIKNKSKTPKRLLDQDREQIRLRHYSIYTEHAYPELLIKNLSWLLLIYVNTKLSISLAITVS